MSNTLTLVIGTKRYSSWSLRPWLAARMAGAEIREIEITLRQPTTKGAILDHSPSGKVPCLIHDGLVVWDSLAICEYLAEVFPEAHLWPDDRKARAVARAVAAEMHSGFPTMRNLCSMDMCATTPLAELVPELTVELERLKTIWNDCRVRFGANKGEGGGPFLFGRFSIADAMYAPMVSRCTTFALPLDPVSSAYCQAIWALPAMTEWREQACG
jgi:glutathione S-transferase